MCFKRADSLLQKKYIFLIKWTRINHICGPINHFEPIGSFLKSKMLFPNLFVDKLINRNGFQSESQSFPKWMFQFSLFKLLVVFSPRHVRTVWVRFWKTSFNKIVDEASMAIISNCLVRQLTSESTKVSVLNKERNVPVYSFMVFLQS